jgi:hypothetical protein
MTKNPLFSVVVFKDSRQALHTAILSPPSQNSALTYYKTTGTTTA